MIKTAPAPTAVTPALPTVPSLESALAKVPSLESALANIEVQLEAVQRKAQATAPAAFAYLIAQRKWVEAEEEAKQQISTVTLAIAALERKRQDMMAALAAARVELHTAHAVRVATLNYLGCNRLIIPYLINSKGEIKRPEHLIAWWIRIFSFLGPSPLCSLRLRWLCRLFRDSLPVPEVWRFPHPRYSTLDMLVNRISTRKAQYEQRAVGELASSASSSSSSTSSTSSALVFIMNGKHRVMTVTGSGKKRLAYLYVRCSMELVGESREGTIIVGGFRIEGKKNDNVRIESMTLQNTKGNNGLYAANGAKFHVKDVSIDRCRYDGVVTHGTYGRLTNCTVTNCGGNGVVAYDDGLVEIYGELTQVTKNCSKGQVHYYGLKGSDSSNNRIVVHAPLTKESVSTNNHNGQNCFGRVFNKK